MRAKRVQGIGVDLQWQPSCHSAARVLVPLLASVLARSDPLLLSRSDPPYKHDLRSTTGSTNWGIRGTVSRSTLADANEMRDWYLLVAIVRKRLTLQANLYTILQILSVSLFEKMPINGVYADHSGPFW